MRGANNMKFSILFYFCVESADLFHQWNKKYSGRSSRNFCWCFL